MDFELNQEQKMFRRVVREFCEAEIKPHAHKTDQTGQMNWDAIRNMADIGLLSLQVPEEYGGADLDTICASIAVEELGRVCGSTALSISAHNGLGLGPIVRWGTDTQKEKYIPLLTSGDYLGALALTEPNAGSDLAGGAKTLATRNGNGWIIEGTKAWITNASHAPTVTTFVRTDRGAGTRGFSMFLVDTDADKLTIHPPEKKMGLKGSQTHMISYDGVHVGEDALLGPEGDGFYQTMQTLDSGRISIGALSVGLAQGAFEAAVKYAQQRQSFGKAISEHQAIQWMIADAALEIEAARTLVFKAAWMRDTGKDYTKMAAMAKLFASEVAERVCKNAIQIHGSYGYSTEFPVERMYRDQRLMSIGEGTSEIQRLVIARRVLKEFEQAVPSMA